MTRAQQIVMGLLAFIAIVATYFAITNNPTPTEDEVIRWYGNHTKLYSLLTDTSASGHQVGFDTAKAMIVAFNDPRINHDDIPGNKTKYAHFLFKDLLKEFVLIDLSDDKIDKLKYTVHNARYYDKDTLISGYLDLHHLRPAPGLKTITAEENTDLSNVNTFLIQVTGNSNIDGSTQNDNESVFLNMGDVCPPNCR